MMHTLKTATKRKDGRTAGAEASHWVALDAFAAVAGGGAVEAEVQRWTGGVAAANNRERCKEIKNITVDECEVYECIT